MAHNQKRVRVFVCIKIVEFSGQILDIKLRYLLFPILITHENLPSVI